MSFEQRRQWVDGLRRIPLSVVLLAAGAEADRQDKTKWHTTRGVLSVNGAKFMNWSLSQGGGGAIDLAMHLTAMDFNGAVQWLSRNCSCPPPPAPMPPQPRLVIPPPDAAQLGHVLRYLREQRRLPSRLLNPLVEGGLLYADARANAVFLLRGREHRAVGAELRGTRGGFWRGMAPGSRKDLGYFCVGPPDAPEAVLCESAIDAISCAAIFPGHRCLSTAGARPNPTWLPPLLAQGRCLYCGYDADPTGDAMAQEMIALYPLIQRLRPSQHDWNDVLRLSV
jgi:hypothetical protein